jgi:hypothetical protein
VRARPVSPERLVDELTDAVAGRARAAGGGAPTGRLRVGLDGAPAAAPGRLADALAEALRVRGHATVRVDAGDFLRPASLRLERGRTDPDVYYEDWLDTAALAREVLDPLEPGGTGRVLPTWWDPVTDRSTRAAYVAVPPGGALLLSGALLLGAGLALDFTVHLALSPAALARRTPAELAWTLPAYARYAAEVMPELVADVVVRVDDPRRPAVVEAR